MTQAFDKGYWESHWERGDDRHDAGPAFGPNPYLLRETSGLLPGAALDAGCGEGAEAIWLAAQGWRVTAADISTQVLARATDRAAHHGTAPGQVQFVEADLGVWEPDELFDLVTTHYAHPEMPQLTFYQRISEWVRPGGTVLIVGHLYAPAAAGHGHSHGPHHEGRPPEEASVTALGITTSLDSTRWDIVTSVETTRSVITRGGEEIQLDDVVVRATRRLPLGSS